MAKNDKSQRSNMLMMAKKKNYGMKMADKKRNSETVNNSNSEVKFEPPHQSNQQWFNGVPDDE